MKSIIRHTLAATAGLIAMVGFMPAQAASADQPPAETITFEQYRDWRVHFVEQRLTQIEAELAAKDLSTQRKASLERQKAYYDFFAEMPAAQRDRRFRDRFDEIDANHDGVIDPAERAAWHEKQRAFYDRPNSYRHQAVANGAGGKQPEPR